MPAVIQPLKRFLEIFQDICGLFEAVIPHPGAFRYFATIFARNAG
jgi:hypothetical protein